MNVYLFSCRPLKIAPGIIAEATGLFSIYTAYHPETLICFDALFITTENTEGPNLLHTQCIYIEETPKILDPEWDYDILERFDEMIANNNFLDVVLPKDTEKDVKENAIALAMQLVTH
ncbi:MAG: hypothetical protein U9Q12_03110 [Patescibacteria group bacterium]|nr:hypothetical protein [Patescibacteria group bacterium]